MNKKLVSLSVSFVLGAVLSILLGRWFGPDRPALSAASASRTAPSLTPSNPLRTVKGLIAKSAESVATSATEISADPSAWLKAWVAARAPGEQGDEAIRMVERWAVADARSALEFVANAARFPGRLNALTVALATLGEQDIAFAANWMKTHLTLDERQEITAEIARHIATKNPALALELAFTPDLPVDRGVLADLISGLVRTQPAQALIYFGRLSEEGRLQAANSFASAWFEADHDAAVQWCAGQRGSVHGRAALKGLIETAARTVPEQLAGFINQLNVLPEEMAAMDFDLRTPDTALALLPHLSEKRRRQAVAEIIRDELPRDPELALKLVRDSLSPEVSHAVIRQAWEIWQYSDRKAAHDWAASIDNPALQLALLGESEDPLLKMDPTRFLAEVDRAGPGSRTPEQINKAIYAVANENPRAAAGWIDRMPGTVSLDIVREVASDWLGRDEQAAWRWINSIEASTTRDTALSAAITHWLVRKQVPEATAALAAISEPRSQAALRWSILQRMHRQDPDSARRWIAAQPMNNDVRDSWIIILEAKP